VTDSPEPPTASAREFAQGFYLTQADMRWFWEQYLDDPAQAANPYAAPLRAPSLHGLPPALVITAEYDPLRDEGEHYAQRLREGGVDVTLSRYDGMVHGFLAFPTPQAANALHQAADWVRALS
jgi:acetyl esterase